MSTVESFLTTEEEEQVVEAIRSSEKLTSGEIRVHLENSNTDNVFERAQQVFHYLKMDNTKQANGVLFYVAVNLRQFVIYGDKGIDKLVGIDFWNTTRDIIQVRFKNREFAAGLVDGVQKIGDVLSLYFPWNNEDTNELSNEISKK